MIMWYAIMRRNHITPVNFVVSCCKYSDRGIEEECVDENFDRYRNTISKKSIRDALRPQDALSLAGCVQVKKLRSPKNVLRTVAKNGSKKNYLDAFTAKMTHDQPPNASLGRRAQKLRSYLYFTSSIVQILGFVLCW
jgi:hypothetical protein